MRYFLSSDGDSRNYIVPMDKKEEWEIWTELDEDNPDRWTAPYYAVQVEGELLSFENPMLDDEPI